MYFKVNFEVRSGYGSPFLSIPVHSGPFRLVNPNLTKDRVTLKCVKDSFSRKGVLFLRKGLLFWLKLLIRIMFDIKYYKTEVTRY